MRRPKRAPTDAELAEERRRRRAEGRGIGAEVVVRLLAGRRLPLYAFPGVDDAPMLRDALADALPGVARELARAAFDGRPPRSPLEDPSVDLAPLRRSLGPRSQKALRRAGEGLVAIAAGVLAEPAVRDAVERLAVLLLEAERLDPLTADGTVQESVPADVFGRLRERVNDDLLTLATELDAATRRGLGPGVDGARLIEQFVGAPDELIDGFAPDDEDEDEVADEAPYED